MFSGCRRRKRRVRVMMNEPSDEAKLRSVAGSFSNSRDCPLKSSLIAKSCSNESATKRSEELRVSYDECHNEKFW